MLINVAFIHRFISSFVFTEIIEVLVLVLLLRFVIRNRNLSLKQILFAGLYASFSTIPYVWFVFPYLTDWPWNTAIIYAEIFVFIIEAIFYRVMLKISWRAAFFASFICNLVSYLLGPLLRTSGLWFNW